MAIEFQRRDFADDEGLAVETAEWTAARLRARLAAAARICANLAERLKDSRDLRPVLASASRLAHINNNYMFFSVRFRVFRETASSGRRPLSPPAPRPRPTP